MPDQFQNQLLGLAAAEDVARLRPHLARVTMDSRMMMEPAGGAIENVYFVEHGVVSVVARNDGRRTEIGLIGAEGMTGIAVLLGDDRSANESYVQVAGEALRIGVSEFRDVVSQCPALKALLLRYVQTFTIQASQTALANAKAKLEERLARWLLMVHDRTGDLHIELTHEFMATMLGSRRAGVTVALHEIEGRGLIKSERGRVTIRDREGLMEHAGDFYGVAEAEYRRIIGVPLSHDQGL